MRNVGKTGVGVVGALVLGASAILAQTQIDRLLGPRGGGRCGERLVRSLGLTAAQQGALATLREETADAIQPIVEQLRTLRDQIDAAVAVDAPDPCAIGGLEIQAAALRAQIDAVRKSAEANFVALLSADQKTKYDNFVAINPGCTAIGGGFGPPPLD